MNDKQLNRGLGKLHDYIERGKQLECALTLAGSLRSELQQTRAQLADADKSICFLGAVIHATSDGTLLEGSAPVLSRRSRELIARSQKSTAAVEQDSASVVGGGQ